MRGAAPSRSGKWFYPGGVTALIVLGWVLLSQLRWMDLAWDGAQPRVIKILQTGECEGDPGPPADVQPTPYCLFAHTCTPRFERRAKKPA